MARNASPALLGSIAVTLAVMMVGVRGEPATIESIPGDGIILRVEEGASVKVAFGAQEPEAVVTKSAFDELSGMYTTLATLLKQTREEMIALEADVAANTKSLAGDQDEELASEIKALSGTVASFETCFKAGKVPGQAGCVSQGYAPCKEADLKLPANSDMQGTGLIPGTSRKFTCQPGYMLKGSPAVHCKLDGTWEQSPSCETAPTTAAPPTNKAWQYWRVANKGPTTWVPVVAEIMLYPLGHNNVCGGKRFAEFDAATHDQTKFLCSGWFGNKDQEKYAGCHLAHDGKKYTYAKPGVGGTFGAWRPQCGTENGGCKAEEAWIGVRFDKPTFVKCLQVLGSTQAPHFSLGYGKGIVGGKLWSGGLSVQASHDGNKWVDLKMEKCDATSCNLNAAVVVDGTA